MLSLLTNHRTKDAFLGASARHVLYHITLYAIEVTYVNVMGKCNIVADTWSRGSSSQADNQVLF